MQARRTSYRYLKQNHTLLPGRRRGLGRFAARYFCGGVFRRLKILSIKSNNYSTTPPALLAVVELLGELASDVESLPEIPAILVALLPLDRVTFGLVRQTPGEAERLLVSAGCHAGADGMAEPLPVAGLPAAQDLGLDREGLADNLEAAAAGAAECTERQISTSLAQSPMRIIRQVDARHRMVLILHWGTRMAELAGEFARLFEAVGDMLAGSLATLLSWRQHPALLGGNFARITPTQWHVLCHLCTERSEKELADLLHMAPHTLHSHIKDIYRRLGVRSRLGAVHLLRQSARHYRARTREWSAPAPDVATEAGCGCPLPDDLFSKRIWVAENTLQRCTALRL